MTIPADPLYQHLLLTAEKEFWRGVVSGEEPRLSVVEPSKLRLEAVRIVDMSASNSCAEPAALFCLTRPAYQGYEGVKADMKKPVPENAKEAVGDGLRQAVEIGRHQLRLCGRGGGRCTAPTAGTASAFPKRIERLCGREKAKGMINGSFRLASWLPSHLMPLGRAHFIAAGGGWASFISSSSRPHTVFSFLRSTSCAHGFVG
jgi:hypothetical protein